MPRYDNQLKLVRKSVCRRKRKYTFVPVCTRQLIDTGPRIKISVSYVVIKTPARTSTKKPTFSKQLRKNVPAH